jgi:predicted Zn finger-like uncharacterized protein
MSDERIDLLCPHCNATFATFLKELAEKNAKVVCPSCGQEHDGQHSPKAANPAAGIKRA